MSKTRMAASLLGKLGGASKDLLFGGMTGGQIAGRLAPDALFGVLAATQTPGDIGDKLIAGGASAIGGGLGGLAVGRAVGSIPGLRNNMTVQNIADFAGSIGGDYAGMYAGDQVMRGKDMLAGGQGLTPYERLGAEDQQAFAQNLERQILAQYGLLPGTREQYADPTTGYGVS